jgi:hypothetical protein
MCANLPSLFDQINAAAEAKKAQRWAAYTPLTRQQLRDTFDEEYVTLAVITDRAEEAPARSTMQGVWASHFIVLKRPTEIRAIKRAMGGGKYDEIIVQRREPPELRWCIFCQERHQPSAFIRHKRYLNNLSFACKESIRTVKGKSWRYLAQSA